MNGAELARETGLPRSVLHRWTQQGIIQACKQSGSGYESLYTTSEQIICMVLAQLRKMGLKQDRLNTVANVLRHKDSWLWWTNKWLIIDDTISVMTSNDEELILGDFGNFGGPWWVLDLKAII